MAHSPPPPPATRDDLLEQTEVQLYADWKRYGHHLKEYGAEFLLTLCCLFCVVGLVSWMFGQSSPLLHVFPSLALRLFLLGLLLGAEGWLAAISPPGRLSGAHANPALSLGFWVLGKMHARDLAGYVAGQIPGAVIGTLLGHFAFGSLAREVHNGTLHPGPSVGPFMAFAGEVITTFVLMFLIYTCVSYKALMRWTPALAMIAVAVLIWLDGNLSGCGMNPARWFGPAASVRDWHLSWVYVLGPLVGAACAAGLRRTGWFTQPVPHTAKLYHDPAYRSVFQHDQAPTTPPVSVWKIMTVP